MKRFLLIIIALLYIATSFAQSRGNSNKELTYKKIKLSNNVEETIQVSDDVEASSNNIQNKSATSATGLEEAFGALSVSLTGGAVYSIPIIVPKGINGVEPTISLNYDSQNGNGLAGYGWNISGVSSISRVSSTKYHDGINDPVDFDNLDRFSLNGQRLILKSGTYGGNGAEYQTENYSNLKILSYGTSPYGANYGPAYFVVYYPDGSFAHYGNSSDSRNQTNYSITYWQNAQDIRINYEYVIEKNSIYISKIKYGNKGTASPVNEIQFRYLERDRSEHSFINGVEFTRDKILKEVKILIGSSIYRRYGLSHNTSVFFDRLTGIVKDGGTGGTTRTTYFTYTTSNTTVNHRGFNTELSLGNIEQRNAETLSLDLTGNGKMDFLVYPKAVSQKNKFWVFKDIQNASLNTAYQINPGAFEKILPVRWLNSNNKILASQGLVIVQNQGTTQVKFGVYSNGSSTPLQYQYERLWSSPTYTETSYCGATPYQKKIPQEYISGDFNGDGLSDVIAIGKSYTYNNCRTVLCDDDDDDPFDPQPLKNASNSILQKSKTEINSQKNPPIGLGDCCECNPITINSSVINFINLDRRITSGYSKQSGYLSGGLKSTDKLLTGDVNGDGKTDILHITNGRVSVYNLDSNNNLQLLWQKYDTAINPNYPALVGDYNGDGKTDFLQPVTINSSSFITFLSTGLDFVKDINTHPFTYYQTNWNSSSATLYGYNLIPVDVNGDGRTDIIDYRTITYNNSSNGEQSLKVHYNRGNYGGASNVFPKFVSGYTIIRQGNLKHFPIPIFLSSDNPNKNLDFASISDSWINSFSFNKNHAEDMLLRSVKNGYTEQVINYSKLSTNLQSSEDLLVYQSTDSEVYPNVDLKDAPNIRVVTSMELIERPNARPAKQVYSYYSAVYNMDGLGFLGFRGTAKSNWYENDSDRMFNITKYDLNLRRAVTDEYVLPYTFNFTSVPSDYITKITHTNNSSLSANKVFKLWKSSIVTQNSLEGTVTNISYLYDSYNNPTRITSNFSGQGSIVKEFTYSNSTGFNYYIGRLAKEIETNTIGSNSFQTETQYIYLNNLVSQLKVKGNGTQFNTENYTYDTFGNLTKKVTIPYNTAARKVTFEFDNTGIYLLKSYDIEGLPTTYEYNTNQGTLSKVINYLGQETSYEYRSRSKKLKKVTDYLGKSITYAYNHTNPGGEVTQVIENREDGTSRAYTGFNGFKKVVVQAENNPILGDFIKKQYRYDAIGRITKISDPYKGSNAYQFTEIEYDFYGRPETITDASGKVTSYTYNNLSVTVNDGTKSSTITKDAMGNIVNVTDPGGTINYTYYGNGTMKTANYDGIIVSNEIDGWGRKIKTIDPSAGTYTYSYNGYNEITKETTPKGATGYSYSSTGKLLQKKVVGDLTNMTMQYTYNSTNKQLSAISLINSDGNNSTYSYTYDNHHRLNYTSEINSYAQFTKRYTYDEFGRIETEDSYARLLANNKSTSKKVRNVYEYEILKTIVDNSTQEVLWNLESINARGQATSITMGNNLRNTFTYDDLGYLTESKSEKDINTSSVELLKLTTNFNPQRGVLNGRTNSLFSLTENFSYDNMDRLVSFNDGNGNQSHSYDNKGRITENSFAGIYNYSGTSYQLSSLDLNSAGLDYFEQEGEQQITYNAFKSPVEIHEKDKDRVNFQYNAFMGRSNMFYGDTQEDKLLRRYRKHYSYDGSMEIKYDKTTGKATFVNYIGGDAYNAPAIWRSEQGASTTNGYYFLQRDYLGSILMISDIDGVIKEKRHFDAWGNIVKLQDGNGNDLSSFNILDRGYTGHEHLQGVRLIHMNGRLYDPVLHRFLAPDNYIQNPYNTQNFNRYGYVLNNPLMYTDPSGEMLEGGSGWFNIFTSFFANSLFGFINSGSSNGYGAGNGSTINNPYASTARQDVSLPVSVGGETYFPDSGFQIGNPYAMSQSSLLQSGTSSEIAHSTGSNDNRNGFWNFVKGTGNGFYNGAVSTVNFVKSLGTKQGWVNIGQGIVDMGARMQPTTVRGAMLNVQSAVAINNFVTNVPNMSDYQLGQAFGFGVEKIAETVLLSKGVGAVGNATRGGLSTTQLVQKSATLAERAIGGTGRFAGTAKHTYANKLLSRYQSIYGDRGLRFNQYFNNNPTLGLGNRGFLDIVNHGSRTIYDFKFGSATWASGQLAKYQRNFAGYSIQIIRP